MRTPTLLLFILILSGCTGNEEHSQENSDNNILTNHSSEASLNAKTTYFELDDKVSYIGFVNTFYFLNNNEIYIDLYFNRNIETYEEYQKVIKLGDSLIYQDNENRRRRIPIEFAQKQFDLTGIKTLDIYDAKNNFICDAEFIRVEYLNQNISPCFIAVFRTKKKLNRGMYYCLGDFEKRIEKAEYASANDSTFIKTIMNTLNIATPTFALENIIINITPNNRDSIISIINSDTCAYIVLSNYSHHEILYKSSEPENISDVLIIPIYKNNMPQILTKCVQPESDMMWDALLFYDGIKYNVSPRQRIKQ